jgi:hypothetical protein
VCEYNASLAPFDDFRRYYASGTIGIAAGFMTFGQGAPAASGGTPTGTRRYNVEHAPGGSKIGGTNSIVLTTPTMPGSVVSHDAYKALYRGPFTCEGPTWVSAWMPILGAGTHWDDPDPAGPWERLYEIFVLGLHPGNSKNKYLAARWQEVWNGDGFVTV